MQEGVKGKALLAAVSVLGLALGVTVAKAEPPPGASPWGAVPTDDTGCGVTGCRSSPVSNQHKAANASKTAWGASTDEKPGGAQSNQHKDAYPPQQSGQLKGDQLKSNQMKLKGMEGGEIPKGMEGGEMPKGPGA